MGGHPHFVHIPIHIGGLDLSVTNAVVTLWLAAAFTFLLLWAGARRLASSTVVTGKFANLVDAMVEFVRVNISEEFLGHHSKQWFGFIAALFLFILFTNLIGKLPLRLSRDSDWRHQCDGGIGRDSFRDCQLVASGSSV